MYVILSPFQIKREHRDEFIESIIEDAKSSVANEEGCLRFDVIQDSNHMDRVWLYEVYKNETAFNAHKASIHFKKVSPVLAKARDQGPPGAGMGSSIIWSSDLS